MRFLGTTDLSTDLKSLLLSVCEQLAVNYRCLVQSYPKKIHDLRDLFINLLNESSLQRPLVVIFDALEQLSRFPLSGPAMRETDLRNLGYRFISAEKYIIIYRPVGDTVFVYHIFDGRSDYPTLFRLELFK